MNRVKGKVAIVSGGSRGLGEAFVRGLVAEGAKVVIADILEKEGLALEKELGKDAHFVHLDVCSEDAWLHVVEIAEDFFGYVTVLVNNAGIGQSSDIDSYSVSDFRHMLDVNVTGVFLGMKSVVSSMRRAGGGSIINISSTSGLRGVPNTVGYTASKFAVRGMTKAAAVELADDSIRVNSVHPGPTRTHMTSKEAVGADITQSIIDTVPAKRLGEPEEFANLVLLLASDEATFATGAEFVLDGGLTCR